MGALGIVLALFHRDRTGQGQSIDASLYGAQLFLAAPTLQPYLATGDESYALQQSRTRTRNPLWNRYRASDAWFSLCGENNDEAWQALVGCGVALGDDARFQDAAGRREHSESLVALLGEAFAAGTAADWVE